MKTFNNIIKHFFLVFILSTVISISFNKDILLNLILSKKMIIPTIVFMLYIGLSSIFFNNKNSFFLIFIHEITHLIFVIVTFNKITGIHISENGGNVEFRGYRNFLISLSPYFFPLLLCIFLLINNVTSIFNNYLSFIIPVLYANYLKGLIKTFSFKQTDIKEQGKWFSLLLVVSINLILPVYLLFYLQGNINQFYLLSNPMQLWKMIF